MNLFYTVINYIDLAYGGKLLNNFMFFDFLIFQSNEFHVFIAKYIIHYSFYFL